MYARVAYAQIKKSMMGEFTKQWNQVQTGNKKVKGWKGASLLVDHSADKIVSITNYESQAEMKATLTAHNERVAKFSYWANTPTTEHYEVVAQV